MPWRQMAPTDIPSVMRIADEIHSALPEDESVFRERLKLFPDGCLVLTETNENEIKNENKNKNERDSEEEIGGYVVSFPIRQGKPPALNAMLGEISRDADQFYIHDVAILPGFRGQGAARAGVEMVLQVAGRYRYESVCLVSVYGTGEFWGRFGFEPGAGDAELEEKVRGYGEDAVYLVRRNG